MKTNSKDLTRGHIVRQILQIALPILFAQIFQSLYNSVDSIVVGNFVGTTALAAVTASGDISRLLVGFFTGLSVGFGILFSQYFGAQDYHKLRVAIHTAILFAILLGTTMAVIGIMITPYLLVLVDCPSDVFPEALQYLRIYFIGVFFTSIYNVASGVLRAVGDTKNPLYYLFTASVINIALDLVLVVWFHMGVSGVAIATIVSQGVTVLLVFSNMLSTKDIYRLSLKELQIDKSMLKKVLKLGLPAAMQSSLITLSNLFIQRFINSFGSSAMAGIGVAKKVDKFVSVIANSIGLSTAIFVAQNVGARKFDRVRRGILSTLGISFFGIVLIGLPTYFFAPMLMRVFTSDIHSIQFGVAMIRTIVPLYYAQALHQIFSNTLRGYGHSIMAMLTTATGMILFRQIFLVTAMHLHYDVHNIYYAYPVGWISSALLSVILYLSVICKKSVMQADSCETDILINESDNVDMPR